MRDDFVNIFARIEHIEQRLFNVDHCASIAVLVAEHLSANDESSALWGVAEMLRMTTNEVDEHMTALRRQLVDLANKVPAPKKRGRPAKKGN